ncbi:MAG: alpha/beta hydrolase [Bacteroidia bacterium]|nr:alpha/beta hydrolase [Bacteroidia bacterium]
MAHSFFQLISGKQVFSGEIWEPSGDIKAVICLVHGHGEYTGRYHYVAKLMNDAGICVIGFDNFGHGKTLGKRGVVPSYEAIMTALKDLLAEAEKRWPGKPRFLYGHSMGGNFVINYALRFQPSLAGVIATSSWLKLAINPPAIQLFLAKITMKIAPGFTQSTKLDAGLISRDPVEADRYRNDPMIHDKMGAVLFFSTYNAGLWAMDHANQFPCPLLIHHGTGDKITSWQASETFANTAGGGDVTLKLWEGLYHETQYEPEKDTVIGVSRDWILDKVS